MTLSNSVVARNSASDGGGIWNGAALTLDDSSVSHNMASASSGGIFETGAGTLTETGSTVSGNQPAP
jgi:hypothetical protein